VPILPFREAPFEFEKSQPKVKGKANEVTMGSLPELHKTSPLMLGTLNHLGVLDFVVKAIQIWTISSPFF
jgi:hypothetical protein